MAPNVLGNALILADAQIEGLNSEDKEGLIKRHVAAFTVSTEQTEALTSTKKSLGKLPLKTHKFQIVWINVILMAYLHTSALYGAFMLLTQAKFYTWVFSKFIFVLIYVNLICLFCVQELQCSIEIFWIDRVLVHINLFNS